MTNPLYGLYAVTMETPGSASILAEQVSLAIAGGARIIQYRDKRTEGAEKRVRASRLLQICRDKGVPLIVNDDLQLACDLGADGVHLGRDDPDPREARSGLGGHAIVGVSCYDDFSRAEAAAEAGASYVAFGSFFPSTTKPNAVPADPRLLALARERLSIPAVAIGGITPQNGGLLIAAGARMLAVVSGVFAQPDIASAARDYSRLFPKETP